MAKLEFFFDCSSPWTYLAFTRIHDVIARTGAEVVWRPILVGGVFNAVNKDVYERRANPDLRKASYYEKDLQDWAGHCGVAIGKPPVFPVRSVAAMRCVIAAGEEGALCAFSRALFDAAAEPKQLFFVPEAGHVNLDRFGGLAAVLSFIERVQ